MAEDYYEVLGIRPRATRAEIELALKGRRSQYHPDRYGGMDAETIAWATTRMQAVNEAYRVLSDPSRRSAFDANRPTARPQGTRPSSSDEAGKQAQRSASRPSAARDAPRRPVILDYLTGLDLEPEDAKRFHLAPNIPAQKLAAALSVRYFAQTAPPSAVHLLVDDTTFRGGADGLLITDEYMSFKSLFMDSQDFRYESSGGWQWQGGFQARKGTVHRQHLTCQTFSFFSASGVQKLVWALNSFFDDRLQWHLAMAEGGNVDSQFFLGGSL